ncbi:MAG TPA: rhomboid family intramembrane serine protease [Acidimicrobiales bacterium]|nr:rhomboid family intramembrane serine protease [Acidimicrobiales bacterium]
MATTDVQTCYRHPDRRAGVVCQRCDRPICPSCMHQASVGFHCPECARTGRQRVVTARSMVTRPVVTYALIALNVGVFVGDLLSPPVAGAAGLHQWGSDGALWGPGVAAGDWWRPVTSGFLHDGLMHVGFNMFLLWQLGTLLEPALRRLGFAALYAMSLLGGSFLTLVLDNDTPAIGASGAVFGLMGAAFVAMRSRGINPFQTGIGPLIVINLLLTFTIPGISIGGHVGGLVAGAVGAWIFWELGPRLGPRSPVPAVACLAIVAVLYVGCLVVAQPLPLPGPVLVPS